ncbi:Membrane protein insertase YidC [Bombilactobacillus mellis]|uniref:Membrane protein insertase YidC n=1 Tax=Bombilactobacillus mellis TaxID=1218508 RepID=A0A0F4KSN5_9LACO|nr:membrane protein insertase YidC [Bombilactobacillus mellis]KJY48236.1 Membrane protein insertase YidC [Bombilactobacillus mellis]MCT6840822.1 membrane protein insertase YidC [Bombilactobacillus mellis]MCT6856882.1 membrane protein insertase YidC [Bombilactobacillus mellis]MCT6872727.1 membrane protein insertase YidC [Bombilactobacillus mellis]MCX0278931.1 membrane protein insertase YidC [Bombilactobacillus mellis]
MSKKKKHLLLLAALFLVVVVVISGCSNINEPITKNSPGFWNHYVLYQFSRFILWLASLVKNSYGWAIVLFTIIVRIILLPINWWQIRSMNKQMQVQPQMKALQEKYSAKDMETQQKLQAETKKLYAEAGINPIAGCLPLLIQLPVMWALYQAIYRTTELRNGHFLWMELGKPDPIYILPILAAIFTFLSTWIANLSQPEQPQATKVMMWIMPIMILIPAITISSAISVYWVVSNAFQVLQTLLLQNPFKYKKQQQEKLQREKQRQKALRKAKKRAFKKR